MTGHADEHERTLAFAEIALGQIKALRQPATPRNYEIWYAYATGYHPSLNQKINEHLNANGVLKGTLGVAKPISYDFTPEECDLLMKAGRRIADRLKP